MASPRPTSMRTLPRLHTRRIGLLVATLGLLAGAAACAGADDGGGGDAAAASAEPTAASVDAPNAVGELDAASADGEPYSPQSGRAEAADTLSALTVEAPTRELRRAAPTDRAVIQKGNVSLASEDVGATRFDAKALVDQFDGEVASEETGTEDDAVNRVRMEIRVPQKSFDKLMEALAELGHLRSSSRSAEDVTTKVIDFETRIRSQERSIERIQSLLARAENLNQVISIESQLARRQADLESQKAKLAYLSDQSELSTITLSLATVEEEAKDPEKKDDESGFVAGLKDGWSGLTSVVVTLATGAGMVLPFGAVLALLLAPVWLLIRRRPARRQDPVEPAIGG
ncbi:DUF4349 domain-containing protein [Nocardioides daejeonensis]|uniref:DUF4349 domain-containing protein n=1 Tax=Nocardioides daejeonensis TaxID=1046556 RepID=UPI0013A57A16|nr:DUF4349 domain-containing protein [Nocardioides daejeonensis]